MLKISILVDNPKSWFVPFAAKLTAMLGKDNEVHLVHRAGDIVPGDMAFLLACTKMVSRKDLAKNRHNLVIHESMLPKGRGWSPLSWQVEEGKGIIPVVLFEAAGRFDAGPVYMRDHIRLDGTELLPEIKEKQALKTMEIVLKFIKQWPDIKPVKQIGRATFYRRRGTDDNRLDINMTIKQQFDKLRVGDNERFPSWFSYRGKRYEVRIYEVKPIGGRKIKR